MLEYPFCNCYHATMRMKTPAPIIDVKKYGGKQVAILDNRIIASGTTLSEVAQKARKLAPKRALHEIKIFAVPKTLSVIYHA